MFLFYTTTNKDDRKDKKMYRLQVKFNGRWKWGIQEYATLEAATERVANLKKVGITARVKLTSELFN